MNLVQKSWPNMDEDRESCPERGSIFFPYLFGGMVQNFIGVNQNPLRNSEQWNDHKPLGYTIYTNHGTNVFQEVFLSDIHDIIPVIRIIRGSIGFCWFRTGIYGNPLSIITMTYHE